MARFTQEDRMVIKALARRGSSNREVARQLGVTEGTVRYHLRREAKGAMDGRTRQEPESARFREATDAYLAARGEAAPRNVADLHAWVVAEHDYAGGCARCSATCAECFAAAVARTSTRGDPARCAGTGGSGGRGAIADTPCCSTSVRFRAVAAAFGAYLCVPSAELEARSCVERRESTLGT